MARIVPVNRERKVTPEPRAERPRAGTGASVSVEVKVLIVFGNGIVGSDQAGERWLAAGLSASRRDSLLREYWSQWSSESWVEVV